MNVIGMSGLIGGFNSSSSSSPFNNGGGTKRPLASCREDLERSWSAISTVSAASSTMQQQQQRPHLVSRDSDGIGYGFVEESDHDDEDNMMMMSQGRNKRRRTGLASVSNSIIDDCMDAEAADGSVATATTTSPDDISMNISTNTTSTGTHPVRISPDNRPPFAMLIDSSTTNNNSNNNNNSGGDISSRPPIKAGWYTGSLSVNGHRHGEGTTKHDDGTGYTGPYVNDLMDGYGTYQFTTTRHLVPNPHMNGNSLHRVIERSFVGNFTRDLPLGKGIMVTKTVDSLPVCGSSQGWASSNYHVPSNIQQMEVIHDVGMHNSDGVAVGEGVRVVYSSSYTPNGSTLQQQCFRLLNGKSTMKVSTEYATWVCSCMGIDVPSPPSTTLSEDVGMLSP
jgi:hypothetical protein